jgi:hypothetical protein
MIITMVKKSNAQQIWIEAKRKYHLSATTIQMAKELRLNPNKFGSIANHKQEIWQAPLADFIRTLYEKSFGDSNG